MKKLYIFSFLLILSTSNILSQSGWFWQNPLPQGNSLYANQLIDNNIGYAVGLAGSFMKTTNNGLNWDDKYFLAGTNSYGNHSPKELRALFFINSMTGFVGSASEYVNNFILRTTNGGITWDSVTSSIYPSLYSIYFVDQNSGWACGGSDMGSGIVLHTTNGGLNWVQINNSIQKINSVFFINSFTGWFAGDRTISGPSSHHVYYIYKTTNGGGNFSFQIYQEEYTFLNSVFFLNENTGWAGGSKLFYTTNSGLNWSVKDTSANSIKFINSSTGYFVGDNGVFKTIDAGNLWNQQSLSSGNSISIVDLNNALIVGNFGSMSKTNNGGTSWSGLSSYVSVSGLYSVKFTNDTTGFIIENSGDYNVGLKSRMLKTTNKGASWIVVSVLASDYMADQCYLNENTGWVVGGKKILKTNNGGYSWDTLFINSTQSLYAVDFFNENFGCSVSGNHASAFYTSNGGLNWVERTIPYYSSKCKVYMFDPYVILLISGGGILRSVNAGLNWQVIGSVSGFDCSTLNISNYIYAKNSNSIFKSTDLGLSWTIVTNAAPTNVYSIQMLDEFTGYASGLGGFLIKTTNGGVNWNRQISKTSSYLRSIYFSNFQSGWAVGDRGTIISTIDGGGNILEINPNLLQIPQSFSLHQNYPNPFNPVTKIKFAIPLSRGVSEGRGVFTKIIIYDLLGREIATLVNEQLKPGSYEASWDGTGFASGVYFYSLVTDNFVETKRMVLIK